jgi:hypothetical protein
VLINQSHTFKDLVLVLDAAEKKLFDGIDGNMSLGDIIGKNSASSLSINSSCRFFERLWHWDQVVFDQSKTAAAVNADVQTIAQTGSIT